MIEDALMDLQRQINDLQRAYNRIEADESGWHYLQAPLTSTSWDGDGYSTTAKTLIDLSAVFGVPARVRAVLVRLLCRDSGSAAGGNIYLLLAPNNTSGSAAVDVWPSGKTNDSWETNTGVCPCDTNGDLYYQSSASGSGTLDVIIQIWGYLL
jgi:hypothetical protein